MHDIGQSALGPANSHSMDFKAGARPVVLDEVQEMELAAELLAIESEEELDQFIGALIPALVSGVGALLKTPIGKKIGSFIKGAAKKILPIGPSLLGLELEGRSPEDQELDMARQLIRFAVEATRQAALSAGGDPDLVARRAVRIAARKYARWLLVPPPQVEMAGRAAPLEQRLPADRKRPVRR